MYLFKLFNEFIGLYSHLVLLALSTTSANLLIASRLEQGCNVALEVEVRCSESDLSAKGISL